MIAIAQQNVEFDFWSKPFQLDDTSECSVLSMLFIVGLQYN